METELIRQARTLAEKTFAGKAFEKHIFHNLEHTAYVVRAAEEIGQHSELSEDEMEAVIIAAWLHDIGYERGSENHEAIAAEKAKELLTKLGAAPRKIAEVSDAIMATKMPQRPRTMVSKVLCDADLHHLSNEQCDTCGAKLRQEWKSLGYKDMPDQDWLQFNLEFMESHEYHTPYGQEVLQKGKKKNIKRLRKMLNNGVSEKKYHKMEEELVKLRSKMEKEKANKPDRGVETMFRTTSTNHIMLSEMADNKANILITINSIILSVVVSVLVRKLEENPRLLIPTLMLVMVCLSTTVFAILATRPNVSSGKFTRDDIKNKRTNLLFFGNFFGMKIEDYEWSMKEMMKDSDYLYGSLIKDIYYLGKVLGRKYKFLRIAYNIFMFGFVLSILSFVIAMASSPKI
jgi:predicted metal-dependent HD superfamily phosphohydrolase